MGNKLHMAYGMGPIYHKSVMFSSYLTVARQLVPRRDPHAEVARQHRRPVVFISPVWRV